MLSQSHHQAYQKLLSALKELGEVLTYPEGETEAWKQKWQQVQQIYQAQVLNLSSEGLEPAIVSRWQSWHTEIHRALKLLQTDILFWSAAKKISKAKARQAKISERLESLINYCQQILQLNEG